MNSARKSSSASVEDLIEPNGAVNLGFNRFNLTGFILH